MLEDNTVTYVGSLIDEELGFIRFLPSASVAC
jgi:hypothetical protein